jgi:hypothetical protein
MWNIYDRIAQWGLSLKNVLIQPFGDSLGPRLGDAGSGISQVSVSGTSLAEHLLSLNKFYFY